MEQLTKYSRDTLINLISHEEEHCRRNKARAEEAEYQAGIEYWQKELEDIEKLTAELITKDITSENQEQVKITRDELSTILSAQTLSRTILADGEQGEITDQSEVVFLEVDDNVLTIHCR